jgi:hypothetical protein
MIRKIDAQALPSAAGATAGVVAAVALTTIYEMMRTRGKPDLRRAKLVAKIATNVARTWTARGSELIEKRQEFHYPGA